MMSDLRLEAVTRDNWKRVMRLKVRPDQMNFVAENSVSLLQAHYEPELRAVPYAIYDGETLVGFVMTCNPDDNPDAGTIWIMRFMIDADHQGKGYGKATILMVLEHLRNSGEYDTVKLSYVPGNDAAKNLYISVGFVEEGLNEEWGEIVARYQLTPPAPATN